MQYEYSQDITMVKQNAKHSIIKQRKLSGIYRYGKFWNIALWPDLQKLNIIAYLSKQSFSFIFLKLLELQPYKAATPERYLYSKHWENKLQVLM